MSVRRVVLEKALKDFWEIVSEFSQTSITSSADRATIVTSFMVMIETLLLQMSVGLKLNMAKLTIGL